MNKKLRNKYVFNEEHLLENIKVFSFPRLAGTEGERKAVDLTVKNFKDIGWFICINCREKPESIIDVLVEFINQLI